MEIEVTVPTVGESITTVEIMRWSKKSGDYVEKDQTVAELETDKINVEISAQNSGTLKILKRPAAVPGLGKLSVTFKQIYRMQQSL